MVLTKDQILEAKPGMEPVEVSWGGGGVVMVREMPAKERDAFQIESMDLDTKEQKLENLSARLCCRTICDENGARMFSNDEVEIVAALPGGELQKITSVAQRLNGFTRKDMEELKGNSGAGQSEDSTSD